MIIWKWNKEKRSSRKNKMNRQIDWLDFVYKMINEEYEAEIHEY